MFLLWSLIKMPWRIWGRGLVNLEQVIQTDRMLGAEAVTQIFLSLHRDERTRFWVSVSSVQGLHNGENPLKACKWGKNIQNLPNMQPKKRHYISHALKQFDNWIYVGELRLQTQKWTCSFFSHYQRATLLGCTHIKRGWNNDSSVFMQLLLWPDSVN